MKKVICLVMLVTLASVSFGAFGPELKILINGEPWQGQDARPSDIITVLFVDPLTTYVGSFGTGFNQTVHPGDEPMDLYLVPGASIGLKKEIVPMADGFQVNIGGTFITVPLPEDNIVFSYRFHVPLVPASTEIIIDTNGVYGSVNRSNMDAVIHVTPEPMTVMLLGLGGLLLRRRK